VQGKIEQAGLGRKDKPRRDGLAVQIGPRKSSRFSKGFLFSDLIVDSNSNQF
jgi:hypothetical protein